MEGEQQTQVLGSTGVRAISCEILLYDREEYHIREPVVVITDCAVVVY